MRDDLAVERGFRQIAEAQLGFALPCRFKRHLP